MRVMVIVKADDDSEAGVPPSERLLAEMGRFNDELLRAGVLLAADGLHPSSEGKRLRFGPHGASVIDGPFTGMRELVAGFWILQVKSMDDAVEWIRRAPVSAAGGTGDIEIELRQLLEPEGVGEPPAPETRAGLPAPTQDSPA